MDLLRGILLRASQSPRLREWVPRQGFARRAVRRFMPGEDPESALEAAQRLQEAGLGTAFTYLGENVTDPDQARQATEHYLALLEEIRRRGLDGEISVKLTQLGLDLSTSLAAWNLDRLARRAAELGTWMWIDMESSPYVDATLEIYRRAHGRHANLGVCLQAYLHRTPRDVETLLDLRPGIRLVKGAYREPPQVALSSGRQIDARFLELAVELLSHIQEGLRLALASHDVPLLEATLRAHTVELPSEAFEIQMLYGVRTADQQALARRGYAVRTLIAYGPAWYAWYVRRLAERPANVLHLVRNLLPA